jgi:hypothetical protein
MNKSLEKKRIKDKHVIELTEQINKLKEKD